MKVAGIVSEFNPFHNGHKYLIEQARANGATHVVAVMSGDFVQRGDVAVIDKFKRADIAVRNGVDLVVEIPVVYSLASAEFFARAAIMLLTSLGIVDELVFGCETPDIELLKAAAEASAKAAASPELTEMLKSGTSYPSAIQQLVERNCGPLVGGMFDGSNDILAIEYIKSSTMMGRDWSYLPVKRIGVGHDSKTTDGNIASASFLRDCIRLNEDISQYVPKETAQTVAEYKDQGRLADVSYLERQILYKMRTMGVQELQNLPDIGQGFEQRILSVGKMAKSYQEFLDASKNKRYTMAKIRRLSLSAIIGIRKQDLQIPPQFGRILALNDAGTEILSEAKGKAMLSFGTSIPQLVSEDSPTSKRFAILSAMAHDVYTLAMENVQNGGLDFTTPIVKVGEETSEKE